MPLMVLLAIGVLLPLVSRAQIQFDPRRVDDSVSTTFFYPSIERSADASLFCTWAEWSDSITGAYGAHMSVWGDPMGDPTVYQRGTTSEFACPPKVFVLPRLVGGETRLIFHQ